MPIGCPCFKVHIQPNAVNKGLHPTIQNNNNNNPYWVCVLSVCFLLFCVLRLCLLDSHRSKPVVFKCNI